MEQSQPSQNIKKLKKQQKQDKKQRKKVNQKEKEVKNQVIKENECKKKQIHLKNVKNIDEEIALIPKNVILPKSIESCILTQIMFYELINNTTQLGQISKQKNEQQNKNNQKQIQSKDHIQVNMLSKNKQIIKILVKNQSVRQYTEKILKLITDKRVSLVELIALHHNIPKLISIVQKIKRQFSSFQKLNQDNQNKILMQNSLQQENKLYLSPSLQNIMIIVLKNIEK